MKGWLAFAEQKLAEVASLARGLDDGASAIAAQLAASDEAIRSRRSSDAVHRRDVQSRLAAVAPAMERRASPYPAAPRCPAGTARIAAVPHHDHRLIPSDGGGARVPGRRSRAASSPRTHYERTVEGWIDEAVRWQEEIGLDVLVHGEFERNDMVKYFGEQLSGFAFTQHGWVQSYGSRCVAPPIIWGDVVAPRRR